MKVRMKKESLIVTSLILAALIVLSLPIGNTQAQPIPPSLLSTDPIDGQQDVDPVGVYLDGITLQFDGLVMFEKVTIAVTSDGQSFEGRTEVDDKPSHARFILEKPLHYEAEIVVMWYAKVLMGGEGQGMFTFTTMSDVPPFVVSITPEPGIPVPEETLREDGITILFNETIDKKLDFEMTADGHVLKDWKARVSKDGYVAWLTSGELSYDTRVFLKCKDQFDRIRRATSEVSWDTKIDYELSIQDLDGNTNPGTGTVYLDAGIHSIEVGWYEGGGGEGMEVEFSFERQITYCFATLTIPSTGQSDPDCIDIDYLDVDTVSLTVGESELLQPKTKCVIEVHLTDIFQNDGYFEIEIGAPDNDVIDTVPPSIVWSDPMDGAQGVEVQGCPEIIGVVTVQFSEPIDESHIVVNVFDSEYVEWTEEWSDEKDTLTINYTAGVELPVEKDVVVEIEVSDASGNELDGDISFTTAAKEE